MRQEEYTINIGNQLIDEAPFNVIAINCNYIIVHLNNKLLSYIGLPAKEVVGRPIMSFLDTASTDKLLECIQDPPLGKSTQHCELTFLFGGNRKITTCVTIKVFAAEGDRPKFTGIYFQDVEDSPSLFHPVKNTSTLQNMVEISRSIMGDLSLKEILQKVTDICTELSGAEYGAFFYNVIDERGEIFQLYTISGARRSDFDKFGMPRNTTLFNHTFSGIGILRSDNILKDPRYGKFAPHHGMPPGHLPVVSYLAVPVISGDNNVIGGLFLGHGQEAVFTDKTEQIVSTIAAQAAIAIEHAKLFDALTIANRRKDEFISIASHELKTPLTSVSLYIQLLEREVAGSGETQIISYIKKSKKFLKKLQGLIEDLLDVSRIQTGKLELRLEWLDFDSFVRKCLEDQQAIHKSHRLLLKGKLVSTIQADPLRVEQVIVNLVSNAVKYSPNSREIFIEMKESPDEVKISIRDHGIGIAEEEKSKIFDRYHRVANENRFSGLGLGLFISREIIELHGGKIGFDSKLNYGSTFYFSLPIKNETHERN